VLSVTNACSDGKAWLGFGRVEDEIGQDHARGYEDALGGDAMLVGDNAIGRRHDVRDHDVVLGQFGNVDALARQDHARGRDDEVGVFLHELVNEPTDSEGSSSTGSDAGDDDWSLQDEPHDDLLGTMDFGDLYLDLAPEELDEVACAFDVFRCKDISSMVLTFKCNDCKCDKHWSFFMGPKQYTPRANCSRCRWSMRIRRASANKKQSPSRLTTSSTSSIHSTRGRRRLKMQTDGKTVMNRELLPRSRVFYARLVPGRA